MKDYLLSYETVYLRPKYSELVSRDNADTSISFGKHKFRLPVVPANMQDVISFENAAWLSRNNYFYIMHRFQGATAKFIEYAHVRKLPVVSVSVGVKNIEKEICYKLGRRIHFITIDVAHGHHELVEKAVEYIRNEFPFTFLIAGNVATREGAGFLANDLKVDAIKVGIGGGSICSTKHETGFHLPTLHSVDEAASVVRGDVPIIADGGAKRFGDIAKALTLGASMVMSGSWFAACKDSPAALVKKQKVYRGSTSYAAKGVDRHIEGHVLSLTPTVTYEQQMKKISDAVKSQISYAGGDNLDAFRTVEWEKVNPS